ncbi:MAG: NifB/NifX family molybdenum-iron cluster-binding protein [Gammaproteobacteria bacterium]|nr:NifB/NifX family molybdenum-iron cluster-binding protein [Gammaproteobacteria bacterium]
MKIAFTTAGDNLSAKLDSRFGRAPKFLIYDLDADKFEIIDNKQNLNAAQGAGIQSAETVIRSGAKILLTGDCGPKACHVLNSAGIKIFITTAESITDALAQYRSGRLSEADTRGVKGYWA